MHLSAILVRNLADGLGAFNIRVNAASLGCACRRRRPRACRTIADIVPDDAELHRFGGHRAVSDAARVMAWLATHRALPDGRPVNAMLMGDHDQYGDEAQNRAEPDASRWRFDPIPW